MIRTGFLLWCGLVMCGACESESNVSLDGGSSSDANDEVPQHSHEELYSPRITTIVLEVDYAPGAEPYTGEVGGFGDLWGLFRSNAEALFADSGKTFVIPTTVEEMEELTDVSAEDFTAAEILDLAELYRDEPNTSSTATFYAVWLDGYFDDGTEVRQDVLGVSIGGTGVIAMFKPVVETTGGSFPNIAKYIEQTTIIHEFGHGVGLVNNGVPMTSEHEDVDNGAHCTNPECVLYYANEGASGAVEFVKDYVTSGGSILFGAECLADTAEYLEANE